MNFTKKTHVQTAYKLQYDGVAPEKANEVYTMLKALNKSNFYEFEPVYFQIQLTDGGVVTAIADSALYVATLSRLVLKYNNHVKMTLHGETAHIQAAVCHIRHKKDNKKGA